MRQQDKRAQRRRLLQSSPFCMDNRGAKKYHIIVECILSGTRRHSCYRRKHLQNEHNPQIYQECYLTVTVVQLNFRNDLPKSKVHIGTLPCHHTVFVVQEGYLIFCNKKFNTKTTFKKWQWCVSSFGGLSIKLDFAHHIMAWYMSLYCDVILW